MLKSGLQTERLNIILGRYKVEQAVQKETENVFIVMIDDISGNCKIF